MKKVFVFAILAIAVIIFSNCHGSKKVTSSIPVVKLNYQTNIQTLIAANCTPCHFPAKGGNKKPFDTYTGAQANIDDMIRRIELNPADKGFMPFKKAKLNDSTIAQFKQWKVDGLLEK